ncbi:MAG: heavy-metal-associated domain-containing protein [Tannerellaceae bacterium]|jgi:copper chaperone CopZ|nr:heavy-metal-associated domain-containing protein [Tannerellaceae bacterium]
MKAKLLTLCLFLLYGFTSLQAAPKNSDEIVFSVNMHCDNCKSKIERALTWHKGVKDLSVKLKALTVRVVFDPRKTSVDALQQAIVDLGYTCQVLPQTGKQQ